MTSEPAFPLRHPRLRKFVDRRLQATLIAGLLVVQLVLVAACIWQLDGRLHAILDAQTFRVHFHAPPTAQTFREEALSLLAWFAVANVVLVLAVELAWWVYVTLVLRHYRGQLDRIARLDTAPGLHGTGLHPLLVLAERWRASERSRVDALRRCLADPDLLGGDAGRQAVVLERVAACLASSQALPPV